jgi:outer membrane protein TolC
LRTGRISGKKFLADIMENGTILKPERDGQKMRDKGLTHHIWIAMLFLSLGGSVFARPADTLSLKKCRKLAVDYSKLLKEKSLQRQLIKVNIRAENTGYLPQAEVIGQATHQSDVTGLPVSMPGVEPLSKEQYKASLNLRQVIYDGGYIARQKHLAVSAQKVEQSRLDVDIQKLKERVNDLYLSVMLINENIRLVELLKTEISLNIEKLSAMLKNGVTLKSNVDLLEVEYLKADQKLIELNSNKTITIGMLSVLMGRALPVNTLFIQPEIAPILGDTQSNRPEYRLFDSQNDRLRDQALLLDSKILPKLTVFAHGGYGRPGLNMLSNEFDWYYLTGVRLSVPLTNWTRTRQLKKSLTYQQSIIKAKKEAFSRNTGMQLNRQLHEMDKYRRLIEKDKAIIVKRSGIKETESVRLSNGVSTSTEFITQLNAENQAILNRKIHEIQLLQAIINYNALKGFE